jgi:hypothetical protein
MTKTVRIENADTSTHPVRVTGQYKNADGEWIDEATYAQIDHPTFMATQTIHSGRRLPHDETQASLLEVVQRRLERRYAERLDSAWQQPEHCPQRSAAQGTPCRRGSVHRREKSPS